MLGVILCYHSFFEFISYQVANLKKHIHVPFKIYLIDNSLTAGKKTQEDVKYIHCWEKGSPSHRHQTSINCGLAEAWLHCDAFLILDNDMVFLNDWTPPSTVLFAPQRRGQLEYAWPNLFFFPKLNCFKRLSFANCPFTHERTDSGGSTGFHLPLLDTQKIVTHPSTGHWWPTYENQYADLCKKFHIDVWYDIFELNGRTIVFHFRALSNWTNYSEEFQKQKKELILQVCDAVP